MSKLDKILLKGISCKSIWFMRQAGRYLPEFRKIRSLNKNFIKICLDSDLSSEITLQPIKRFDLDSAIIFSDILMVPFALGQNIEFIQNSGPELSELKINTFLNKTEKEFSGDLAPVYKAIEKTRKHLSKEKSLICFIGAPWTLLVYMLNLKKNKFKLDQNKFNKLNEKNEIINKIIEFSCIHVKNQIEAGADVVQVFDSWAGLIPEKLINDFCYKPNLKIINFCKKIKIPNICFPKGMKEKYLDFNEIVKPDGINLDYEVDPIWAKNNLRNVVIQGGLDPKILLKPDKEMIKEAKKYIDIFRDIPYVFNLGHGLLPETDPDKVKKLVEFYRSY